MPELPEVETTRLGIAPWIISHRISQLTIYNPKLRYPVDPDLPTIVQGLRLNDIQRRAKYLLFDCDGQGLLIHLGMSGSLRLIKEGEPLRPHDHWEMVFDNGSRLRYHDPRRFGSLQWWKGDAQKHPRLCDLGIEPLCDAFSGDWLYCATRNRKMAIKSFLMNAKRVVGIGNIYANEALFIAGVSPMRPAEKLSQTKAELLVDAVRAVLQDSIKQGGTTLRDFVNGHGEPGYFKLSLKVYERNEQPCLQCGRPIQKTTLNQRSTWFCPHCQK